MGPQAWLPLRLPLRAFPDHCAVIGIMLLLRLAMIQTEPVMTRNTISTPKARARILLVLSGPVPRCRKKEVDADLREGEYDQTDGDARGPEQIGLRHDERGDRRKDRKHQTHGVRQVAGRGLTLFDTGRPVLEQTIAH